MKPLRALLLLALPAASVFAGNGRWTGSGPGEVGFLPTSSAVVQIEIDPADDLTAYALVAHVGIFRTTDAGAHWETANGNLLPDVSAIAIGAEESEVLFAASRATVYASTDGGRHFVRRGFVGSVSINSFALDPAAKRFYAATTGGIFFSTDRGITWTAAKMPRQSMPVMSLAIAPDGSLFAIGELVLSGKVLRSTDHGQSWSVVASAPVGTHVVVDPSDAAVYVADEILSHPNSGLMFVSHDDGAHWTALPRQRGISRIAAAGGRLYAATDSGLFRYDVGAQTWTPLPDLSGIVSTLAVSSSEVPRLYAAPDAGLYTERDGDSQWTPAVNGLPGVPTRPVAVVPGNPSTVFAGTYPGIFKSSDGAQNWTKSSDMQVADIQASADGSVYITSGAGIEKTTDEGSRWTVVTPNAALASIAPSDPGTLYAFFQEGLARSSNKGNTWNVILTDLTGTAYDFYYGYFLYGLGGPAMSVDRQNSANVFAATYSTSYKTTDGGATWTKLPGLPGATGVAFDDSDSQVLYAVRDGQMGLLKSADGGVTWAITTLIDKRLTSIVSRKSHLYVATDDGHVYRSGDRGAHWTLRDAGLSRAAIVRLDADPSGEFLYAGTDAGVWAYHVVDENPAITPVQGDTSRLERIIGSGVVLPVAGSVADSGGASYSTDVTIVNLRAAPQNLELVWLPDTASNSAAAGFRLTLPSSDANGGAVAITDIAARLGTSGLASLVVVPLDGDGNADSSASIAVSAQIAAQYDDGRAPAGQTLTPADASLAGSVAEQVSGLRNGSDFRTSVGIVNLTDQPRLFTISVVGDFGRDELPVTVPPLAIRQIAVPEEDSGLLSFNISADDGAARWIAFATTNDRLTGDAATVNATRIPLP